MEKHVVIVTGQFPPMRLASGTRESAEACAAHIREMFPRLRDGLVYVVPADHWQAEESCPPHGFPRDCVQAFITTGNGAKRPAAGSLKLES